jgi:hypothetical protein
METFTVGRAQMHWPNAPGCRTHAASAASNAVGAVAKDTLTATNAVIAAAEDTLGAAKEKLRKVGEEMQK